MKFNPHMMTYELYYGVHKTVSVAAETVYPNRFPQGSIRDEMLMRHFATVTGMQNAVIAICALIRIAPPEQVADAGKKVGGE